MIIGLAAITREIVIACRQIGQAVSDTYAAFVASTIINPNTGTFYVDKSLDEGDARYLVEAAVRKIFSRGDPSVETLRLQAIYDAAFLDQARKLQKEAKQRGDQQAKLTKEIASSGNQQDQKQSKSSLDDFDFLASLYRKVFQLLLLRAGVIDKPIATKDPAVEREVAAALESVFPRVGLRPFISLTPAEREAQLGELCSIVLGIRLFNQHVRKGGVGLTKIDQTQVEEAKKFETELQKDIWAVTELCNSFSDILMYAGIAPSALNDGLADKPLQAGENSPVPPEVFDQVRRELLYQRQHLSYLMSLHEDVATSAERLQKACAALHEELGELEALIGLQSSVPKSQVYPRFDSLARLYQTCLATHAWLTSRQKLADILRQSKKDYGPKPSVDLLRSAQQQKLINPMSFLLMHKDDEGPPPMSGDPTETPIRLTLETTPEFLQLPLDFQGFCIWSIVKQRGLLTPGNPALGVVKYKGRFCVFAHEKALEDFMQAPEKYFLSIRTACLRSPELIHLLRLHSDFPRPLCSTCCSAQRKPIALH